jgi:hypothetical protein
MRVYRVLDGELVQIELSPDGVELLRGRLVEAEPDEGPVLLTGLERLGRVKLSSMPFSFLVNGTVDNHGAKYAPVV